MQGPKKEITDLRNPHRKIRRHTEYYKVSALFLDTIYHSLELTKAYSFYTVLRHQYKQTDILDYKTKYHAICKLTGIRSINTVKKYIDIIVSQNWAQIQTGQKSKRKHLRLFSTKKIAEQNKIRTHKIFSIQKSKIKNQKAMEDWFTFLMVNNNKDRQYYNAYKKVEFSTGTGNQNANGEKRKVRAASIRTLLDTYTRKLPSKLATSTEINQSQKQIGKLFHRSPATANRRLNRAEKNEILVQQRKKLVRLQYSPHRPTRSFMDELGEKNGGYVYYFDNAIWLKKSSSYIADPGIKFEPSPVEETKFRDAKSALRGKIVNQFLKWYKSRLIYDDKGRPEGITEYQRKTDFVGVVKYHSRYVKPVKSEETRKAARRISNFIQAMDKKVLIQDNCTF